MKVFIESTSLQRGQIESDGIGFIGIFAEKIMAAEVVFGELDKLWGSGFVAIGEDLFEDMGAELLDANLAVSSLRRD